MPFPYLQENQQTPTTISSAGVVIVHASTARLAETLGACGTPEDVLRQHVRDHGKEDLVPKQSHRPISLRCP